MKSLVFRALSGKDQMPSVHLWWYKGRGWTWGQASSNSGHFSARTTL